MSTVGRRLPRCRTCPSKMIIVIRTCGWWSRGGRLRLITSHHISWQVLGNLAVVCSMCSIWCFRKLPRIHGWVDGRMVSQTFLRPTPVHELLYLAPATLDLSFVSPRDLSTSNHAINPTIVSSVIFFVKEPLWMSPSKSDVSIFRTSQ